MYDPESCRPTSNRTGVRMEKLKLDLNIQSSPWGPMTRAWRTPEVGKHHRANRKVKKARKAQRKARRNNR